MAKKKIIRKSNRTLNIYAEGGQTWGQQSSAQFSNAFKVSNLGGTIGGIGSGISGIVGAGMQNAQIADTSGLENKIKEAQTYKVSANNNDTLMSEWSAFSPMEHVNWRDIRGSSGGQQAMNTIGGVASGAAAGATVGGPIGAVVGGAAGLISGIASIFSGNRKAKKKAKKFNKQINAANEKNLVAFEDRASNIDTQNDLAALSNFAAYGGYLPAFGGALDYDLAQKDLQNKQLDIMSKYKLTSMPNSFEMEDGMFAKGGKIHIKKANRGKFTEYCGGKVTSECIARGKRSSNPAVRKRATFAANARKWHHALGGYLYDEGGNLYTSIPNIGQHGGNFSNGVTIIGNGGSHEENPFEGVPMGIAPDGTPNLVEQGEVKFNNYVFSNRLFATGGLLAAHNLPTTYADHSFADIAERLSKESSERPNDPISKRGLMSAMTRLQQAQEQVRMEENRSGNKYAHGGKIGRKYDGEGDEPNLLQFYTPQERWLRTLQRQGVVPTYELPAFKKPYSMMTPEERTASFNLEVPSLVDTRTPAERWVDENIKPIQFNPSAITGDAGSDTDTEDPNTNSSRQGRGLTWLRYAPAVGAGLGVLTDALGWTNSPDYGNADLVGSAVDNLTNVEFTPIGNYLTYRPLDRNYYINKLNAQAGATRRAIVNQSGGNRATALAGLLAADYNAQNVLGDLARQAEEYNFNQRKEVETFNRGTNQFNSEMGLKASIANQANDKLRLQARTTQAQLRDQADARSSAGRAANLTNLFDSLGEIGREEFSRNMIQTNPALYYSIDSSGRITYKNGYEDLSEAEKKVVRDAANRDKGKKKAKGGYLTIRKGK